jgi:hypothetical protein
LSSWSVASGAGAPGKATIAAAAAPVAAAPKKKPRREGLDRLSCIFVSKEACLLCNYFHTLCQSAAHHNGLLK